MTGTNNRVVPGIVLRSIAGGMLLMALFTYGWINVGISGWHAKGMAWLWLAVIFSALLIVNALYFFIMSKHFPGLSGAADKAEGKRMGMWYGIIFGGEGAVIGGTCAVLSITGHAEFIIPAIALIIGIHFFPMAKLFRRTIDYYIATWTCLVGLTGIYLVSNGADISVTNTVTGFGVAAATAAYGIYMILAGYKVLRTRHIKQ